MLRVSNKVKLERGIKFLHADGPIRDVTAEQEVTHSFIKHVYQVVCS